MLWSLFHSTKLEYDAQQTDILKERADLFRGFAAGRRFEGLAALDAAAGHKPACDIRLPHQHHLPVTDHHYTHAERRRPDKEKIDLVE